MRTNKAARLGMLSVSFGALLSAAFIGTAVAQQVRVDADDIGGVVTGAKGPEAGMGRCGRDLPTKHVKIVYRRRGRYLVPIFPKAITTFGCACRLVRRR